MRWWYRAALLTLFIGPTPVATGDSVNLAPRNVLCLHAYHKAAWTDSLNRGYESVFDAWPHVTLHYEYMDTKKAQSPEYLSLLHRLYELKFEGLTFDLVLTSDDNALHYALEHDDDIFGNAPIVFCGVNRYEPGLLPENGLVTGVVEKGDFRETLAAAMRLRPDARKVFTVCDSTETSQTNVREFESVLGADYPQLSLETSHGMTVAELSRALAAMRPEDIVFFIAFWRDAAGAGVSPDELGELFHNCPAPVFGRSEWMIGRGMLGGMCVSGFHQGESAAGMAARILAGSHPGDIPVNTNSPNRFMFGHEDMLRHGIAETDLPPGSMVIGRPVGGVRVSTRRLVEIGIAVTLLALFAVTLLVLLVMRHRSAQRLAQSERNYREIFNATDDAILIHDAQSGRVLDVNRAMLDIYGFTYSDVIGIVPGELSGGHPPYSSREALKLIHRSVDAPQVFEWQARRRDGSLFWVEVSLRRSDLAGEERVIAVVRDISERKAAESRDAETRERLIRWERIESLGVLAGGVAHDLNNILGPLVALPPLLSSELHAVAAGDRDALKRMQADLGAIASSADRASGAIRDLMAVGRQSDIVREPVDVGALLTDFTTGKEAEHLRESHPDIQMALGSARQLPPVAGTASHIHRIVGNLVRNAFDALADGTGRVIVDARAASLPEGYAGHEVVPPGDYVVVAVRDNGPGVPDAFLGHIFEPFFTKKVQTSASGSGLGLTIVRSLAKDLDAYVDCRNDGGAVFEVYLPVMPVATVTEAAATPAQSGTEHVLVVDDEPAQRDLARRVLERYGYKVSTAVSGTDAIEQLARKQAHGDAVNLVVLDAVMPADISGIETLSRIRASHPNVAVLMVSGYALEQDMTLAREQGADWLSKPYSPEQLALRVRRSLDARA